MASPTKVPQIVKIPDCALRYQQEAAGIHGGAQELAKSLPKMFALDKIIFDLLLSLCSLSLSRTSPLLLLGQVGLDLCFGSFNLVQHLF